MKRYILIISLLILTVLFSGCSSAGSDDKTDNDNTSAPEAEQENTGTEIEGTGQQSGKSITVVCLGDSVTQGIFELAPGTSDHFIGYVVDPEAAYPSLLLNALTERGIDATVINSGISGNYVSDGIRRLERDVLNYDPDIVTVCFGLNDVCSGDAELYEYNLGALFDMIKAYNENIRIVFMTPNMLASRVADEVTDSYFNTMVAMGNVEITESGLLDIFMESAKKVCAEHNIPVCDAYSYWKNLYESGEDITSLLASYCTHPSREMHKVFCDMLIETFVDNGIIASE